MPNLKSSKKALRQNLKRYERNKRIRMRLKRWIKKFNALIAQEKKEEAKKILPFVQKLIDKANKRNIIHSNKAARLKSRLYKSLSA